MSALFSFIFALIVFANGVLTSPNEALVHKFQAGFDGFEPRAGLVADTAGNLYGTTFWGGGTAGAGTVYRLSPPSVPGGAWTESVIHRFSYHNVAMGLSPWGGLAIDSAGNLYGTAWLGGACGSCGLVFELSPAPTGKWRFQVIHNFASNGLDGINPQADLTIDRAGNLFGTTASGGTGSCFGGCGTVFELSRAGNAWQERVLHSFVGHGYGDNRFGGTGGDVVVDRHGDLFGTALEDGIGLGTVFKLARSPQGEWTYRVLYAFQNFADGAIPAAGVTLDANGDLFGTTEHGGVHGCYGSGCGTIFELTRNPDGRWFHTVLYDFLGTGDGGTPTASLLLDASGKLYGTTQLWGVGNGCPSSGCGVAFRLAPPSVREGQWTQTVLHTFRNGGDGFVPDGALIFGPAGLIYGTTQFGGKSTCSSGFGCGTVFTLTP